MLECYLKLTAAAADFSFGTAAILLYTVFKLLMF
jgi:hypothetical protein